MEINYETIKRIEDRLDQMDSILNYVITELEQKKIIATHKK